MHMKMAGVMAAITWRNQGEMLLYYINNFHIHRRYAYRAMILSYKANIYFLEINLINKHTRTYLS